MELSNSMFIGFLRIFLFLLFIFFINKRLLRYSPQEDMLDFLLKRWIKYVSLLMVLIFIMIQINSYDRFSLLTLLTAFIFYRFFEIKNIGKALEDFKHKISSMIVFMLKNQESNKMTLSLNKKTKENKKDKYSLIIILIIAIITIFSRYYFYSANNYLLSDLWSTNLLKVKSFNAQKWFSDDYLMSGEHALMNFYTKLSGVSSEIALESFGIFETIILTVVLYWFVTKVSGSKIVAPIIATLFFAISPMLMPISISDLTKHNSIFLALSFALPMMIYTVKPNLLTLNKWNFLLNAIVVYLAIGFIDLFILLAIIPPFLVVSFFFYNVKTARLYFLSILAYFCATSLLLGIYALYCYSSGIYFETFLRTSLIDVSAFTYLPDLVLPYERLLKIYQYISIASGLLVILLLRGNKKYWINSLLFILYFNVLIILSTLEFLKIDEDLLKFVFYIFIPIIIGITSSILFRLVVNLILYLFPKFNFRYRYGVILLFVGVTLFFMVFQNTIFHNTTKSSNITERHILKAYDKISNSYLPYSHTVVNVDLVSSSLSVDQHFYMSYKDFNYSYLEKDSIYFIYKNDKSYLKEHPEVILSEKILLFIYSLNDNNKIEPYKNEIIAAENTVDKLKKRGRKIELYYENETLKVLEITNSPKSGKFSELIF